MNSIKKVAIAILAVCAVSSMSIAVAAPKDTSNAEQPANVRQGMAALNLTEEQKARIKEIREITKTQVETAQNDTSLSQEAKQAKLKEIRRSSEEQIRAVLTPEQQQKLKEMNGKSPEQAPAMRGPGSMIAEKLTLTDDQKAKIKGIQEAAKAQIETVQKDTSLSQDAKQAKQKEIRKSAEEQIHALLTPEQLKELREMNNKASVQAPRTPELGRGIMAELNLTEDQKASIKSINQAARSEMEAVRSDTSLTKDAREAKLKSIRESAMTRIRAVLTPEQQQKLDAARASDKTPKQKE
jgi:Spy/CpxP family protein refolding chaperone